MAISSKDFERLCNAIKWILSQQVYLQWLDTMRGNTYNKIIYKKWIQKIFY